MKTTDSDANRCTTIYNNDEYYEGPNNTYKNNSRINMDLETKVNGT